MLKVLNALKKVCDRVCSRAGNSAGKRIDCLARIGYLVQILWDSTNPREAL